MQKREFICLYTFIRIKPSGLKAFVKIYFTIVEVKEELSCSLAYSLGERGILKSNIEGKYISSDIRKMSVQFDGNKS